MAPRKPGEQARRDARARNLGYRSDYDYRAHGYGRVPPDQPRLAGGELRRARGHASLADLERELAAGNVEMLSIQAIRNAKGQIERVDFLATLANGETVEFSIAGRRIFGVTLPGALGGLPSSGTIDRLHRAIDEGGGSDRILIVGSPPDIISSLGG
jgi:hypothetical protein